MAKLADWLAEAGHNVTFYQQAIIDSVNKVGVTKANAYVRPRGNITVPEFSQLNFWTPNIEANNQWLAHCGMLQSKACESQLNDESLFQKIRSEQYDYAVVEYIDYCSYAIIEKAGIEKYGTASALMIDKQILEALGLALSLGVVPNWSDQLSPLPTFIERITALYRHYLNTYTQRKNLYGPTINVIQSLSNLTFDIKEKMAQSSYFFINADEYLTHQQPISSKILYVGGKNSKSMPVNSLNQDIQNIVDSAEEGVVLVSFGTVAKASEMPKQLSDALVDTFKSYPKINFIWKYEVEDTVGANVTNLFKRPWVPQHDLLGNKKILAFITHGGLNSISETAEMGVPTVCMPVFGDQPLNCQAAQAHGISIMIDKADVTAEKLIKALDTVMHDQRIRQKAAEMSNLMNNKPISTKERFVRHVEHAIRFNVHEALDLPVRSQGFVRGYNLDFIAVYFVLLTVLMFMLYCVLKVVFRIVRAFVNIVMNDGSNNKVGLKQKAQ
ncbi:unnamed protein product [Bursaphelenchus okinawaensis]|uniref:UDP-glucuronosyltransferase n=1 Tax=Bursaphelenchus okinawaensis TaxID=465554 RepID=A0A811K302_9BILA|nr:unnamed protein product [Bursaphelenchus okinawaensis]CAG9090224.1 unnamed protein product [Bursaphelenchus okinawaensis]